MNNPPKPPAITKEKELLLNQRIAKVSKDIELESQLTWVALGTRGSVCKVPTR